MHPVTIQNLRRRKLVNNFHGAPHFAVAISPSCQVLGKKKLIEGKYPVRHLNTVRQQLILANLRKL